MLIGELAAHTGVTAKTLRFYERQGLVSEPGRTEGGYRDYDRAMVDRVSFIKDAQAAGFTLAPRSSSAWPDSVPCGPSCATSRHDRSSSIRATATATAG